MNATPPSPAPETEAALAVDHLTSQVLASTARDASLLTTEPLAPEGRTPMDPSTQFLATTPLTSPEPCTTNPGSAPPGSTAPGVNAVGSTAAAVGSTVVGAAAPETPGLGGVTETSATERATAAAPAAAAARPADATVPRQHIGPYDPRPHRTTTGTAPLSDPAPDPHHPAGADPLDDPDPQRAADAAAVENLLRCWVRETNLPAPGSTTLRIPLDASGTALLVPVRYWSPTGWHRFGAPALEGLPATAPAVDAVTVAALLSRESGRPEGTELVGRVADSARRTADFLTERRRSPQPHPDADLFLAAEQSLLLGHPLHPTPKSREGLSDAEARLYSPELHGSFPLHWLAVDSSLLASDSGWTEQGRPVSAEQLAIGLAEGLTLPAGTAPLPVHPWQARELLHRSDIRALVDAGLLHDLGLHGSPWHPTSSVRTVHRPGARAMLKLSLGLRITNSRRENLRKELHRGVEVHRLLRTGLVDEWQAAHPGFDIVRDPAWLAVDTPDGAPVPGLDLMIRHNPFGPGDDAVCIASLTAPRPWPGTGAMRSRLADVISRLAARTGRPTTAVAAEWFLRYLDQVVRPVLWLDGHAGIALEAHQQNTLVLLDPDGWPVGGRYRDNQGYYFRESHRSELESRLPGIGAASDTFVSDQVTDERFAYYLGINNVLGLIGAFGAQHLADERVLLAAFRSFLTSSTSLGSPLPHRLLEAATLRSKANLLTRLHGMDELVGPVDTQSVYVTVTNPLRT
ncbi:iron transporter [Streptomyces sp. MBT42]|uniref:IucA/IucC family protein n=1 Tax=Streptomyces sp. MBT42 TaxID=1488373 RepID=UPI001E420A33|nr:IucA/IucC family protein [Streptomyces sp. MBT42]MCD2463953.1 iron transporter [Streptomyces sp. MBT42]